jgi:hypothetical protein
MGQYGSLLINNRLIKITREEIDMFIHVIFHKDDLKVFEIGEDDPDAEDFDDEHSEKEVKHVLSAEAGIVLQRLNVLGITDSAMRQEFEDFKQDKIDDLTFHIEEEYTFIDGYIKERKFWKRHQLDDFLKGLAKLVHSDRDKIKAVPDEKVYSNITNYLMEHDSYDLFGALPFYDDLFSIRAFLTAVDSKIELVFDYTELHDADIYSDDALEMVLGVKDRIIILTEGSSDISILKPSLEFLYPHLYEHYSFFDFESFNSQGGAGNLINMIKSFAGAGISNKIIALFDNDTAARESQANLKELSLPDHIKILNCPHLSFAESYPTLGPTGSHNMDINGLACSIELYLGTDVLKDPKGNFYEIFWKGYSTKMKSYQGEVLSKGDIQERFLKKLTDCKNDPAALTKTDWSGLVSIFEMIFDCFNEEKNKYQSVLAPGFCYERTQVEV